MKKGCYLRACFGVAFAGVLLLEGCGPVHYPTNYLLNLPAPAVRTPGPARAFGTVAVREFRCPAYLCDGRIVYRPNEEEVGFYEFHRWALSPREAITQFVVDDLRAQSVFQTVSPSEKGVNPAYVLSGNIEKLEEVDQGRDVRAVCTLFAQLADAHTGSVIWSKTASKSVAVEPRNITGVVNSLSDAAQVSVDELVESIAAQFQTVASQ
jgi:cholesterol transport system auxiliary component